MNPGAWWMSSVGTVRSRMAASANSSSTTGKARVKRWAMRWKWAVSPLLCGRDGNLSLDLIARGEKWLPRAQMLSQPACDSRFTSCLPRVLHFTWAGRAWIWIYVPPPCGWSPPLLSEWKQLQGYWCCGGKNVFISARTAAQTAAHLHAGHCAHLNLWKVGGWWYTQIAMAYGGRDPDCCTQGLKGWMFSVQEVHLHPNWCSSVSDLQLWSSSSKVWASKSFCFPSLFLINSHSEECLYLAEYVTFSLALCTYSSFGLPCFLKLIN